MAATLVPATQLALLSGEIRVLGPFDIADDALSVRVSAQRQLWPSRIDVGAGSIVFSADLEVSFDAGKSWAPAGSFGANGGTDPLKGGDAPANFIRIGLQPGKGRLGRVTVRAQAALSTSIVVDNSIVIGTPNSASGFADNGSVTVDAGSAGDRCLFAFCLRDGRTPLDSFTYNAVALDVIGQAGSTVFATARRTVGPATGSHTLAFDHSSQGTSNFLLVGVPASGVDQVTPNGAPVNGTFSTPSTSAAVSSADGHVVLDGAFFAGLASPNTITVGGGQTELAHSDTTGGSNCSSGASSEPGGVSVTMSWTGNNTPTAGAQIAFDVNPSSPPSVNPDFLLFPIKKLADRAAGLS